MAGLSSTPVGSIDRGDSPQEVKRFHEKDDVDFNADAHHHTLGIGTNQAYPGYLGEILRKLYNVLNSSLTSLSAYVTAINTRLVAVERKFADEYTVTITASSQGFLDITFPVGRFIAAPSVVVTTGNSFYLGAVTLITSSGCRIFAAHRDGTSSTANVNCQVVAMARG